MSIVDIFNFEEKKINFSAIVNSTSSEGGVTYQKVYYNFNGDKFYFELPSVEISISKNTKKKYEAYSAKVKLSTCKENQKIVEIFNAIYKKTAVFIEENKGKLNFKNKAKFKADKAEESGLANALYYITDKETGERTSTPPLLYANMVIDNKNKTVLKYPSGINQFKVMDWKSYLDYKIVCLPVVTVSNIFIGSDGSLRIQLQLKSATVLEVKEGVDIDQSSSFQKYGIEFNYQSFKLPESSSSGCGNSDETCEVENLDDLLANE